MKEIFRTNIELILQTLIHFYQRLFYQHQKPALILSTLNSQVFWFAITLIFFRLHEKLNFDADYLGHKLLILNQT